jgi:hypothetical protein
VNAHINRPPANLAEATERLRESNERLAAVHERPSKPPSAPRLRVELTTERRAEIAKLAKNNPTLLTFAPLMGVSPSEWQAFIEGLK